MIKRSILSLSILCLALFAKAQNCSCTVMFNHLVTKIEENYPGYEDKITPLVKPTFEKFTSDLREKTTTATAKGCYNLLKNWIAYFKDQHLSIILNTDRMNNDFIRSIFSNDPRAKLNTDSLKKHFSKMDNPGTLEGIWKLFNYEVALVKNGIHKKDYQGIIIKADSVYWVPGQIKFELKYKSGKSYHVTFMDLEHNTKEFDITAALTDTVLSINDSQWKKTTPILYNSVSASHITLPITSVNDDDFYFKKINERTSILRLSDFFLHHKPIIDSLVSNNFTSIINTPNLVIDIRGNRGGFNISFDKLLPIFYTNPIVSKDVSILLTKENIALYEELLSNFQFPAEKRQEVTALIAKMKREKSRYLVEPDEIYNQDTVYSFPQKISIIIDNQCASAAEQFILRAKQSKKVTLFGMHTAGINDYTNIVGPRKFICAGYILYCPTAKSNRLPEYPIDNIGIKPDVTIPSAEKDWITYVQNYIEKK